MRLRVALLAALALALAAPALASERHPSQAELEGEVICPTCHTTLDQSNSPIAERMKAYIRQRIEQGATKSQIENELVAQFGESVLASPPRRGFNLLAWLLPIVGILGGAGVLGLLVWRWSRRREDAPRVGPAAPLDPELERRLDDALARFDA
jgi:cytochrome c-type biogenesis protein CcmH